MNDKFLEILSKSSGRTITRPYDGSLLIKLDLPELEKFAELIVKECCTVINDYGDHIRKVEDNWDGKSAYLGMKIRGSVYEIEGHFGVVDER